MTRLAADGLYDPAFEHDNCGFGFVADVKGRAAHRVVAHALEMLANMEHRGGCGCDPDSGDGAGILVGTPDAFLRRAAQEVKVELPPPGEYATAMMFLPHDLVLRRKCERLFERVLADYDMEVVGWRDVPTDNSTLGGMSREVEPRVRQAFVGMKRQFFDRGDFNRRLYLVRQRVENAIEHGDGRDWPAEVREQFYICTLSTNRLVYKGMLTAPQLLRYYPDLAEPDFAAHFAVVHSRFSTNTFPSWRLAHPYRYLAHNGEINTIRGNRNWMRARYASLRSERFGTELDKLFPILSSATSDSATLDNALQFLAVNGRGLAHAMLMLIPEAWQNDARMDPDLRAFYEYHACLMEPWDGPAGVAFTNGRQLGAMLDRNGLRPARYYVTHDDLIVMGSEAGAVDLPPEAVKLKWRLQPGKMLLADFEQGRIVDDAEVKGELLDARPWGRWLRENLLEIGRDDGEPDAGVPADRDGLLVRQRAFGYTNEDLKMLVYPMAAVGAEAVGSMGTDTPLACLSDRPQPLFNYFKQLFAQVTNPPLDAIREEMVTSLVTYLGHEQNLLAETPRHARLLKLDGPVVTARPTRPHPPGLRGRGRLPLRDRDLHLRRRPSRPRRGARAGDRRGLPRGQRGDPRRGVGRDPQRPRRRPRPDADPVPALHRRRPPPPDPRGDADAVRAGDRDGRGPRGASLLLPARLRRGGHLPVPGLRDDRRPARRRPLPRRHDPRRGDPQLRQGGPQGDPEGGEQDGHQHRPELPRGADLRGAGRRAGDDRPALHRHPQPHRRRRAGGDRRGGPHEAPPRLPPRRGRAVPRPGGRRVLPVAP